MNYDSYFLAGFAPSLYSVKGDGHFALNTMPVLTEGLKIPLGFVKNASTSFSISLQETIPDITIYLTDLKTNTTLNLSQNPVYNFTANEGDDVNRFSLSFATGVGIQPKLTSGIQIYTYDKMLVVNQSEVQKGRIMVYNTSGLLVNSQNLAPTTSQTVSLRNLSTGIYMVTINTAKELLRQKVFIK
jgi:hypothetical protein